MKMLITGGNGALGSALKARFPDAFCPSSKDMDVTDKERVRKVLLDFEPDVLIHTAALVGIRECEEDKAKAWETNVEGTQNIVDALDELGNDCYLIHVSTACVFAGEQERYYTEEDVPAPKNYYSVTKLCSELVIRQYPHRCLVRTNFVPRGEWKYPKAFTDRFGTYLFADQVAQGISDVLEKRESGIVHIVGDRRLSMFELARLAGSKDVGEMTLDDYEGPPLTVDMSLSTKRWKKYSTS